MDIIQPAADFLSCHHCGRHSALLFLGSDELVALTVDIDDLNLVVVLEVLAQLCDIHIH